MISPSLNEIFQSSIMLAKKLHHEYLTIEHVFYFLLHSRDGAEIISVCGGDVPYMKEALYKYIQEQIEVLPEHIHIDPYESVALARLIDSMIQHVQSAQQQSAEVGDLLAAIFEEKNTFRKCSHC